MVLQIACQSSSPFILPLSPWKNSEFLFWNFHIQQPELNFMSATLPIFNGIKSCNIHQGLKSLLLCKRFSLSVPCSVSMYPIIHTHLSTLCSSDVSVIWIGLTMGLMEFFLEVFWWISPMTWILPSCSHNPSRMMNNFKVKGSKWKDIAYICFSSPRPENNIAAVGASLIPPAVCFPSLLFLRQTLRLALKAVGKHK